MPHDTRKAVGRLRSGGAKGERLRYCFGKCDDAAANVRESMDGLFLANPCEMSDGECASILDMKSIYRPGDACNFHMSGSDVIKPSGLPETKIDQSVLLTKMCNLKLRKCIPREIEESALFWYT